MKEIVVSNTIVGWDDELVVGNIFWNHKCRLSLRPILPYHFFRIVEHIKQMAFLWKFSSIDKGTQLIIRINLALSNDVCRTVN